MSTTISIFNARKRSKEGALAVSVPFLRKANVYPEACLANLCLCVIVQNCMACGLSEGKKGFLKKKKKKKVSFLSQLIRVEIKDKRVGRVH